MRLRGISVRTSGAVLLALLAALLFARSGAQAAATATASAPPLLKVQVIGLGTVTGGGIGCGNGSLTCSASYSGGGATVTLKESPASGWTFDHWTDDCTGTASSCPVSVTGDQTVTAVFKTAGAVQSSTLNVALGGAGTVTNSSTSSGQSNYEINCTSDGTTTTGPCSAQVVSGSTLTVEEQPGSGLFAGWGGSCAGDQLTCSVQVTNNRAVSASFSSTASTKLTVNVNGPGSVGVDNYTCSNGATCTYDEPPTANLMLTAVPSPGYAFTGWTDDCQGTQNQCNVQMTTDHTVTANFAPLVPILITVGGDGIVTGPGIKCGPGPVTCNAQAAPGQTLQLTATPGPTSTSDISWSGCDTSAGAICTINISTTDTAVAVEADFTAGTNTGGGGGGGGGGGSVFTISTSVTGAGYVTAFGTSLYCTVARGPVCAISVQQNATVTLVATPAPGATFTGWGGTCSGLSNSCSFVANGAKSATAAFQNGTPTTKTLKTATSGSGSGTVTGLGIHCPAAGGLSCSSPEPTNVTVTLTATAAAGSTFTGWSGACTTTGPVCSVYMTADESATANFTSSGGGGGGGGGSGSQTLTVDVTGAGHVALPSSACAATSTKPNTCTSQYRDGTAVELKAVPAHGYAFEGWKGACTGKKATCTVTMDSAHSVSASFRRLALAPSTRKPTVAKISTGYRITLRFTAAEAGRLNAVARHAGSKPVATTRKIKPGAGLIRITVKTTGRYVIVLTLHAKSGAHAIRYTVRI